MEELAIIIPAYKNIFFSKSLESLAQQTCKNFTVYVGDDCSPHNLKQIVDAYAGQLNICYTRFGENIGSKNIVNQWNRCVALSSNEEWIWLFSDDDVADKTCVENFYRTKKAQGDIFDVYRFNTCVIDANDVLTSCTPVGPQIESSEEMAYHLLLGKRGNSMPDHIFRRKVFNLNDGFVFTRYAQAADWASSILFSKETGICIISEAMIYWRVSGQNISSLAAKDRRLMMHGHLDFIHWILQHFDHLKSSKTGITYYMIQQAAKLNLVNTVISHYKGFDSKTASILFKVFNKDLQLSVKESVKSLFTILINSNDNNRKLYKLIKRT